MAVVWIKANVEIQTPGLLETGVSFWEFYYTTKKEDLSMIA